MHVLRAVAALIGHGVCFHQIHPKYSDTRQSSTWQRNQYHLQRLTLTDVESKRIIVTVRDPLAVSIPSCLLCLRDVYI